MEEQHVDPYAPPTAANESSNTTYLNEDGYAFQNQLVANQYFKSPLICAKLGIPIPPESRLDPKSITVTWESTISKYYYVAFFWLCLIYYIVSNTLFANSNPLYIIIFYIIGSQILKRLFYRPYQIRFYFSEQYTRIRRNRIFIFSIIFIILAILLVSGIASQHAEAIAFSIFGIIITLIIFRFKTAYFTVTETKGDYHYIRGVHPNLLNALPQLPVSQQSY